ncbi:ABC transporter ATP-binding protein [Actinacidiphila bryophytorum]|uniref:ATP-binding cassette, subfamily B n=1 Tax=Actinacidiphila bryophytorum TaxID=1436133 RepID=A0A9W4GZ78_9ACTN|nr:ABC transporter ATP-binding protein [Actinacidiphila bryophytorum]MBM9435429.1 ABC transporter ATP-binding protein [Actinacidiphila bryophytorum]MBN6545235.1 ABC transporter ATP-binding protein [Actinacidiphila bryophytorum]CAG7608010.1 ATP-binding cassette, subfamily B [Actinacidiphila bryophytorum]
MPATTPDPAPAARSRSSIRSLLRLWPYVRPIRARLGASAVVGVVASSMGLLIPLVLKWLVDGPVTDQDPSGVWLGGGLVLLLGLLEAGLFGLRRWLVARPLAGVEASMRSDLYQRLQRLPVSFHDRWASGQLLSRATMDLQILRMFLAFPLVFLFVNATTMLIGFGILLAQSPLLTLVLLGPAVPLVVLSMRFETRYALAARRAQDQAGDLATLVEESVLGVRIIKAFGRHRTQSQAFHQQARDLRGTELHKARLLSDLWAIIMTLPELAIGVALVVGVLQVSDGKLSTGTLVAFLTTALALRWPVESIGFLLAMSNEAATAADRYFEPMTMQGAEASEAADGKDAEDLTADLTADPAAVRPGGDGLRMAGVGFRYPDAPAGSAPVLTGVDLHIRSGETMALVGATGCGKTTLTALVPRLHEPTSGRITLDGADTAAMPVARLRELVAVAFEEPTLFSATVRENVAMGAGPSGADEAAVLRALEIAQCGFVHALPQGLDTQVGEQGLSLSGGQRQRLALARAVVGRPQFLILDDPLSALDVHTEALVEAALRDVLRETTALVVAHRPSTVALADRVALLSQGRVSAVGTHQELLRDNTEYRRLMSGLDTAVEPLERSDAR